MRVSNPDRSPVTIHNCNTAPKSQRRIGGFGFTVSIVADTQASSIPLPESYLVFERA